LPDRSQRDLVTSCCPFDGAGNSGQLSTGNWPVWQKKGQPPG